jgi:hypothetical protein
MMKMMMVMRMRMWERGRGRSCRREGRCAAHGTYNSARRLYVERSGSAQYRTSTRTWRSCCIGGRTRLAVSLYLILDPRKTLTIKSQSDQSRCRNPNQTIRTEHCGSGRTSGRTTADGLNDMGSLSSHSNDPDPDHESQSQSQPQSQSQSQFEDGVTMADYLAFTTHVSEKMRKPSCSLDGFEKALGERGVSEESKNACVPQDYSYSYARSYSHAGSYCCASRDGFADSLTMTPIAASGRSCSTAHTSWVNPVESPASGTIGRDE